MSSKGWNEKRLMHSISNSIKIMTDNETDEVTE